MWPSAQLRLLANWIMDRSSASIFDVIDAAAVVARFVNDQFRNGGAETAFMSAPTKAMTDKQLVDALNAAADQGEACAYPAFVGPGAVDLSGIDWKSILKKLLPLLLSLFS
jgi:hypothetical protein